jgi:hypothetical protein
MDDRLEVGTPVANACSYTNPSEYSIRTTTDHESEAPAAEIPAEGIPIRAAKVAAHRPRNSTLFTSFSVAGFGITSLLVSGLAMAVSATEPLSPREDACVL